MTGLRDAVLRDAVLRDAVLRDAVLRDAVLAAGRAAGSRESGWALVLAAVAAAHGLGDDPGLPELAPWREPDAADRLGDVHASVLAADGDRGSRGAFYTPSTLVDWLVDRTLGPTGGDGPPCVLDPSCGTGNILLAALRRLGPDAVARLHGVDTDPVAVAIARLRLRIAAPATAPAILEQTIRVGDGLAASEQRFDVVVGNPPFLGRLRARTATVPTRGLGAYTDASAVFLHRALDRVRPGGLVALVQPWSLLAARDARSVRAAVRERGALEAFWASATPVFPGTSVATCAPVVRLGGAQGEVATWHGPDAVPGPSVALPAEPRDPGAEWGGLVAPALGVPVVRPSTRGTLGDLAGVTADFRDQYYGLVPHVGEGGTGAPLVTAGLIDPARCRWGETPVRFARRAWTRPTVDLDSLSAADPALAAWAARRLVPKVLLAPQGRVLEAVVDEAGEWLPSVPVVTLTADPADPAALWHVLAVLLAPPVVALAAGRYAGSGLSASALRLSARQVAVLPLPADSAAWDDGARLARVAQHAADVDRPAALRDLAACMSEAYADDAARAWWVDRLPTGRGR